MTIYAVDHTALPIVAPYNEFMSEGGKFYEANLDPMLVGLDRAPGQPSYRTGGFVLTEKLHAPNCAAQEFLGQFARNCPGFSTQSVRYLIALTDPKTGIYQGVVLCPGKLLAEHFVYVADKSFKCQRSIPMAFFDRFDGQAVFNPAYR